MWGFFFEIFWNIRKNIYICLNKITNMGTNYYRIPKAEEMEHRKRVLIQQVTDLELLPSNIERKFRVEKNNSWEYESPWDIFLEDANVHLGKRSSGWKFCWNFHNKKYYSNKEQLLKFIQGGRIVDEYGDEWDTEMFIEMSMNWGQPDGLVVNEEYRKKERGKGHGSFWLDSEKYDDLIIDGLRVANTTEFC